MATPIDIVVDQGSDITYEFQATALDGSAFPLTGANITLTARTSVNDPAAAILYHTGTNILITDAANGTWSVSFTSNSTYALNPVAYVYDQVAFFNNGQKYRLSQGTVYINPAITSE